MPAVSLPAPVALARLTDSLTPLGAGSALWEPKFDGFRCVAAGGRLYSQRGTNLTPLFPDLAPVLAARLPADLVLDGELVAWDTDAGRLDFASLQARVTAGCRIRSVAARRPAQLVAFDVLASGDEDLRPRPLRARRRVLELALSGLASPIVLCQQTDDQVVAQEWFRTLTAGGIEGLVIKDAGGAYPVRVGQRVWWKVKAKATLDMVAIGNTGPPSAPSTLVLAFPGDVDEDGTLRTAGSTTALTKGAARQVTSLLRPTGDSFERIFVCFERIFVWGSTTPSTVTVIEPIVIEVSADASAEHGVLRHAARLLRARPDLDVDELEV